MAYNVVIEMGPGAAAAARAETARGDAATSAAAAATSETNAGNSEAASAASAAAALVSETNAGASEVATAASAAAALVSETNAGASEVATAADRVATEAAKLAAQEAEAQSEVNALAAGAQIYDDTTAGLAGTSSGDYFYVPTLPSGLLVYKNDGGSASLEGRLGDGYTYPARDLVAATHATAFSDGTVVTIGGLQYAVDSAATGTASATSDLGVDGLVPSGQATVQHYGAVGGGTIDDTAAFQRALDSGAGIIFVPAGRYRIDGTLDMPTGSTLFGESRMALYYATLTAQVGVHLFKDSASDDGPIIDRRMSTGLSGIYLEHRKVGGLQDGVMRYKGDRLITNCVTDHVYVTGIRTPSVDLDPVTGDAGFGIKFEHCPDVNSPSYFNTHNEVYVTECDVGIRLGQLCNGNRFNGYQIRECHIEVDLIGNDATDAGYTGQTIENVFSNGGHFAIGLLTPRPIAFRLRNAVHNVFMAYAYESYGKEFDVDEATCSGNIFAGAANAANPSVASGQVNLRHAQPNNFSMKTRMPLITSPGAADREIFVGGGTTKQIFQVAGDMPQQNNNAGTLVAGDADNKVIFRFPTNFTKTGKRSFTGKLKVFAYGAFGNGCGVVEVDFGYSMRSQSTSAGEFHVFSVKQMGNEISGLHFLTGVAAGAPMGVALVGGNYGAYAFSWIRCEIEFTVTDILTTEDIYSDYLDLTSTTTADVTADDVTDAIDMLTVANTAV